MDGHAQIQAYCDRIHHLATAVPDLRVRKEFESISDSIEMLTKAYMVPEVAFDWRQYRLTPVETRLAEYLRVRWNKVCSKEQMHAAVYSGRPDGGPELKTIDVMICHIRRKMRDTDCPHGIAVCWGQGYRMTDRESAYASASLAFTPAAPAFYDWNGYRISAGTYPILKTLAAVSPEPASLVTFISQHGRNSVNVRLHHLRRRLAGKYIIKWYPAGCYALLPVPTTARQSIKAA